LWIPSGKPEKKAWPERLKSSIGKTVFQVVYSKQAKKDARKLASSNLQHRIVYEVFPEENKVLILRMWTHYGD